MEVKNKSKKGINSKRIATDWSPNTKHQMSYLAQVSDLNSMYGRCQSYIRTPEKDKKSFNITEDIHQYKEGYEQMQQIMMEENNNLRRQIQFLAGEVRKNLKRQRCEKEAAQLLKDQNRQIKSQIDKLRSENLRIKQCITAQMLILIKSFKTNSIEQVYSEVQGIIQQLNTYLNIDIEGRRHKRKLKDTKSTISHLNNSNNFQEQINRLNDKFEELMEQYSGTHQQNIREECIKIAKKMHNLKKKCQEQNVNINFNLNSNLTERVNQQHIKSRQNYNFHRPQTDRVFNEPYVSSNHHRKHTQEQLSQTQKSNISDIRRHSYTKSAFDFNQQHRSRERLPYWK